MTDAEIASAGVQPDFAPDAEIAKAISVQPPLDERTMDFEEDTQTEKERLKERKALFRYPDGTYSDGRETIRMGPGLNRLGVPRELAAIKTVKYWWESVAWGNGSRLEILLDKPREPRADGRKSDLSEHFTANFIGLIESAPTNPMVRAHMMKVLKQMPEDSLDTFEKLKDWVEANFFASSLPPTTEKNPGIRTAARPQPRIEIEFKVSETETGRCSYSVDRSGTFNHEVTVSQLTDWIAEGKTMEDILDAIKEDARDSDYDMDDYGEYDHSDYDSQDSTNYSFERNTPEGRAVEQIRNLLYQHAPESLETLDNN